MKDRMVKNITREELKRKLESKEDFILADARESAEYRKEHIKGAIRLPMMIVAKRVQELGLGKDKNKEIVVYCRAIDCDASTVASKKLEELGFTNVSHYAQGIEDWKKAGYKTEAEIEGKTDKMETRYICTGSCHGAVTEKEFKSGKNKCGAVTCEKHGQPLVKRLFCPKCKVYFKEGEKHICK